VTKQSSALESVLLDCFATHGGMRRFKVTAQFLVKLEAFHEPVS
jgi:hypothetical protein